MINLKVYTRFIFHWNNYKTTLFQNISLWSWKDGLAVKNAYCHSFRGLKFSSQHLQEKAHNCLKLHLQRETNTLCRHSTCVHTPIVHRSTLNSELTLNKNIYEHTHIYKYTYMHIHVYTYMHTYIVAERMAHCLRTLTEHPDSVPSPVAYYRL